MLYFLVIVQCTSFCLILVMTDGQYWGEKKKGVHNFAGASSRFELSSVSLFRSIKSLFKLFKKKKSTQLLNPSKSPNW